MKISNNNIQILTADDFYKLNSKIKRTKKTIKTLKNNLKKLLDIKNNIPGITPSTPLKWINFVNKYENI
jgi:hypothetical protein